MNDIVFEKKQFFSLASYLYHCPLASNMGYFTEGGVATYGCGGYAVLGAGGHGLFFPGSWVAV